MENHGDFFATEFLVRFALSGQGVEGDFTVFFVVGDGAFFNAAQVREQTHDCIGCDRFATARLADDTQGTTLADVEGHTADGWVIPLVGVKTDVEIFHTDNDILFHDETSLTDLGGVGGITQTVADEVDAEDKQGDNHANWQPNPPCFTHNGQVLGGVEDVAPGGDFQGYAQG